MRRYYTGIIWWLSSLIPYKEPVSKAIQFHEARNHRRMQAGSRRHELGISRLGAGVWRFRMGV